MATNQERIDGLTAQVAKVADEINSLKNALVAEINALKDQLAAGEDLDFSALEAKVQEIDGIVPDPTPDPEPGPVEPEPEPADPVPGTE